MPPRQEDPALPGGLGTGLQSFSPAFLALTRVTVDELPRLVPPCEAALPPQKACWVAYPRLADKYLGPYGQLTRL